MSVYIHVHIRAYIYTLMYTCMHPWRRSALCDVPVFVFM